LTTAGHPLPSKALLCRALPALPGGDSFGTTLAPTPFEQSAPARTLSVMLSFTNPLLLLLALLIPPLIGWQLRQRRNALRHSTVYLLRDLPRGKSRWGRRGPIFLRGLALLLLVVALSGPRWPDLRTRIETEGVALLMVVDVSGSMAERDFVWEGLPVPRLDAVKRVFRLFLEGGKESEDLPEGINPADFPGRKTDLVGLVCFASRPVTRCPLTLSHSVPLELLDEEQPRKLTGESETNVSDAVVLGLKRLQVAGLTRKVLVLLTDGEHNVVDPRSGWTPRQVAQLAASLEVPIYVIDAGGGGGRGEQSSLSASPAEVREQAILTMQELAHISGGRYFQAQDTQGLLDAYRIIDQMERSEIQSFQYRRYHEAYPWFALASFALFLVTGFLQRTLWRRLP
jgi:Ca-activated chloride channel family protein